MQLVLIINLFIVNRIKIIIGETYFTFVIYIPDLQLYRLEYQAIYNIFGT